MEMLVGGRYAVGDKLGSGTFGGVFKGRDEVTGEDVAIKLENASIVGTGTFGREARVLMNLKGLLGFPKVMWEGKVDEQSAIVMELLGEDLSTLRKKTALSTLDLKSVLMIALQVIDRLQALHGKGFVHNDLKPANMAIGGTGETKDIVYLIDFGQSVRFLSRLEKGTVLFSSIASHFRGVALAKEDMECLGYVLVYLMTGNLPWKYTKSESEDNRDDVLALKIACKETLCFNLPEEFGLYMDYVYGLTAGDAVDYDYARMLFNNLFQRAGLVHDGIFPWSQTPAAFSLTPVPPCAPKVRTRKSLAVAAWVPNVPAALSAALRSVLRERVNKITPEVPLEIKSVSASPVVAARKRADAFDAAEQEKDDDCGTTKWEPSVQSTRKPSRRPSTSFYF